MRVGVYAAMAANCSRVQLAKLAHTQPGKQWLDVGIYQNRHWKVKIKTVRCRNADVTTMTSPLP